MGKCIMGECYNDVKALHYVQWQAVPFRLPLAQHKALGWWDAPLAQLAMSPGFHAPYQGLQY